MKKKQITTLLEMNIHPLLLTLLIKKQKTSSPSYSPFFFFYENKGLQPNKRNLLDLEKPSICSISTPKKDEGEESKIQKI